MEEYMKSELSSKNGSHKYSAWVPGHPAPSTC